MNYHKMNDESAQDFIGRICSVREDLGFTWEDVADYINKELGLNLSERTYRRRYDEYLRSISQIENIEHESFINELDDELMSIKKERYKLRDEINQVNNLVRLQAREEQMREAAIEAAEIVSRVKLLEPIVPKRKSLVNPVKQGILAIGDWHYGIDVNVYWNTYNPVICRNRVKLLATKVLEIIDKEELDTLHIINLGDMISGRIHLPLRINSRCDVVTQTIEVSEILAEFISMLSSVVKINYYSVSDNHSRIEPNKKESLQTEAFTRIIDWYLKERLRDHANIKFHENVYGDDICSFDVFNHQVGAVHGDKDKAHKLIQNINLYTQEHFDLLISAHLHHFSGDESNETLRLCNGSLMGCDDFSSGLRLNSKPSQLLIVSSKENVSECIYKINLK